MRYATRARRFRPTFDTLAARIVPSSLDISPMDPVLVTGSDTKPSIDVDPMAPVLVSETSDSTSATR